MSIIKKIIKNQRIFQGKGTEGEVKKPFINFTSFIPKTKKGVPVSNL